MKKKNSKRAATPKPARAGREEPRRRTPGGGRAGLTVGLLGLCVAVLTLALPYTSYGSADIRAASCDFKIKSWEGQPDPLTGNHLLRVVLVTRLRNHSFKGGHVSRFELAPTAIGVTPDYKITYLDHATLGWGEERDVEVHAQFTIDPTSHARLTALRQPLSLRLLGYDDAGKPIANEAGEPFYLDLQLKGALGTSVAGGATPVNNPARPS